MFDTREQVKEELQKGSHLSIVSLVEALITDAHRMRASDIHFEPTAQNVRVRFRVDGVLEDVFSLPKGIQSEVISRIKVLSGLRTDEHQMPQDGRFCSALSAGAIDVRVSIAPTYHGENAALRLLADTADDFSLAALGFSEADSKKIVQAIQKTYGMILATGPTGSGKTTTLYTLLKMLNCPGISIITIEDPIEYAISGITQIQVNPRTGLAFSSGLRSILRQDPNVIMVGEIRDGETASIAVNTALTGHLLLSTLHTNDAATTLPRLLDMKIDPYLVASTANIAIGQRLVRRICSQCKHRIPIADDARVYIKGILGKESKNLSGLYRGAGCDACNATGYRGRIGINEVLEVDNDIRNAILRKASTVEIRSLACSAGMTTMVADGLAKAIAGETTVEEVIRAIHE